MNTNKEMLSIEDFEKFYREDELGDLTFPNGTKFSLTLDIAGPNQAPYFIRLKDLYKATYDWAVLDKAIPLLKPVGIIAYGNTVKYPGYTIEPVTHKKWRFFGPEITKEEKVPIDVHSAYFLLVTEKNPVPLEHVTGRTSMIAHCARRLDDIYVDVRSIDQVIKGLQQGRKNNVDTDSETIKAFTGGVPIFFNNEELEYIISSTNIVNDNPRQATWNFYDKKLWGMVR